jgi:hypothetical protein
MNRQRWTAVSESAYDWERDALDFLRTNLPDHAPWRAWSNLEFVDDEGRVNEVDLLLLAPFGLVLVEIKSRPGSVKGDAHSWTWTTEGRPIVTDNPLPLANRKAKRLASLLRQQPAIRARGRTAAPWVEPLIFLSAVRQPPDIDAGTSKRIALRGQPGKPDDRGVIGMLLRGDEFGSVSRRASLLVIAGRNGYALVLCRGRAGCVAQDAGRQRSGNGPSARRRAIAGSAASIARSSSTSVAPVC